MQSTVSWIAPFRDPEHSAPVRWPALMSEEDAAEYVGVSVTTFRKERDEGLWPPPVDRGCRRNTYSKKAIDDAIARLTGHSNTGGNHNEWDAADAAL